MTHHWFLIIQMALPWRLGDQVNNCWSNGGQTIFLWSFIGSNDFLLSLGIHMTFNGPCGVQIPRQFSLGVLWLPWLPFIPWIVFDSQKIFRNLYISHLIFKSPNDYPINNGLNDSLLALVTRQWSFVV